MQYSPRFAATSRGLAHRTTGQIATGSEAVPSDPAEPPALDEEESTLEERGPAAASGSPANGVCHAADTRRRRPAVVREGRRWFARTSLAQPCAPPHVVGALGASVPAHAPWLSWAIHARTSMRLIVLTAAALLVASSLPAQDDPLRVLRHSPSDTASPDDVITVTFDRPVAGALDRTVEAAKILRIEPNVEGNIGWRDPVTIRFIPKDPLVPGTKLRVTVDTGFRAFDGSHLLRPYRFEFRVRGPLLLAHSRGHSPAPVGQWLPLDGKIQLLFSAPVDLGELGKGVRLELPGCEGAREIRMTTVRQRPVGEDDS